MTKENVQGQQVQTVAQSKTKNFAIEFWRFFFAIAIVGYHIGTIYARSLGFNATPIMAGAGEILFVFTLTAGYFLVKHFKRLQANPEYVQRKASVRAAEYIWDRIKALLPVLGLGILLGVAATASWNGYDFKFAFLSVVNGLWEFLGLYSAGYNAALRQANGAMWFISGLLICSYFIYWAICKNEDFVRGFLAPAMFVFFGGWWAYTGTRASQAGWSTLGAQLGSGTGTTGNGGASASFGINNGLLFVLVGMAGGVLIYYLVEYLRTKKFNLVTKILLTILYAVVAVTLVVYTINPELVAGNYSISGTNVIPATKSFYRWTAHLLCMLLVGLTLLEKDYVTQLLNNKFTQKFFGYLGGMALYVYMVHCPFIFAYAQWRGVTAATVAGGVPYTFTEVYLAVLAISIPLGALLKFLMDRFVLRKKKVAVAGAGTMVVPKTASQTVEVENKPTKKVAKKPTAKKSTAKKPVAKKTVAKAETKVAPKATKAPAKKVSAKAPAKTTKTGVKVETKKPAKAATKPAAKKVVSKAPAKKSTKKTK